MSGLWSPQRKFSTWRRLWVALAEAEAELGLPVTTDQIAEMKDHLLTISISPPPRRSRTAVCCGTMSWPMCILLAMFAPRPKPSSTWALRAVMSPTTPICCSCGNHSSWSATGLLSSSNSWPTLQKNIAICLAWRLHTSNRPSQRPSASGHASGRMISFWTWPRLSSVSILSKPWDRKARPAPKRAFWNCSMATTARPGDWMNWSARKSASMAATL